MLAALLVRLLSPALQLPFVSAVRDGRQAGTPVSGFGGCSAARRPAHLPSPWLVCDIWSSLGTMARVGAVLPHLLVLSALLGRGEQVLQAPPPCAGLSQSCRTSAASFTPPAWPNAAACRCRRGGRRRGWPAASAAGPAHFHWRACPWRSCSTRTTPRSTRPAQPAGPAAIPRGSARFACPSPFPRSAHFTCPRNFP